jgi:hypothetical protein
MPIASTFVRQHTSAYVSIRQHTSAYVSIRQHTSAYLSIAADSRHLRVCVWRARRRSAVRSGGTRRVSVRQHTSAYVSVCAIQVPVGGVKGLEEEWGEERRYDTHELCGLVEVELPDVYLPAALAYVSIRQHTPAYHQHASAYGIARRVSARRVSIRQHTSAYVGVRTSVEHTHSCIKSDV